MVSNYLRKEWIKLKKEFDLNPSEDILGRLKILDEKIKKIDKQTQRYHTPRGNYEK